MFKYVLVTEIKGGEGRIYRVECNPNSPLDELIRALDLAKEKCVEALPKLDDSQKDKYERQEEQER